jgi:putative DNA methylase
MVVEAIQYNSAMLKHYQVHAFVVMPNHVHLLVTPSIALPKLTRSLKGITAKRANEMLGLTGSPFWQDESYDRLVRNQAELNRVRAGLVSEAAQYRWSSGWAAGGPAPHCPNYCRSRELKKYRSSTAAVSGASDP